MMKRYREILVLIVVVVVCAITIGLRSTKSDTAASKNKGRPAPILTPRAGTFSPDSLSIGGIFLGNSRDAVTKKLGEPLKGPDLSGDNNYWYYEGLRVQFFEEKVHRISGQSLELQGNTILTPQTRQDEIRRLMKDHRLVSYRLGVAYKFDSDRWELNIDRARDYPIMLAAKL